MSFCRLLAAALLLASGCATRTVREGPEALETLATPDPAVAGPKARPAALARVEVLGEDLHQAWDDTALVWIPLVPFARAGQACVRGHEVGPEIEKVLWPRFQNAPGQRSVVIRVTLEEGRYEEVRTAYGLSILGTALAAVFGAPMRYMQGTVVARFDVVDADAPPGAPAIFSKSVAATFTARAGIAALFYWYDTGAKPRDLVYEAWARALARLVAALPPAESPVWAVRPRPGATAIAK
jgi:hypothetical protein